MSEQADNVTICVKCAHHKRTERNEIWYNHFCHHPDRAHKKVLDYVTGKMVYTEGRPHPYCNRINDDGKCPLFKASIAASVRSAVGL